MFFIEFKRMRAGLRMPKGYWFRFSMVYHRVRMPVATSEGVGFKHFVEEWADSV